MDRAELERIVKELATDKSTPINITPRDLFNALGFQRRTSTNCSVVDSFLDEHNIEIEPSYNDVWIDVPVSMRHKPMASSKIEEDPVKRVKVLRSAHTEPCYVNNNDDLNKAITLMQLHDYSQLPVTNNGLRGICGFISWKTIGISLANGIKSDKVKDYVDKDIVALNQETPLMDVVNKVRKHDFAVVINNRKELCGIITTSDIASQFISSTEPFIYTEQIESFLRLLLKDVFLLEEIKNICAEQERTQSVSSIDDLTFGEYIRLIESEENWNKLGLPIDRKIFIERMDKVRQLRNDIMHFEPAGITDKDKQLLSETSAFLGNIIKMRNLQRTIDSQPQK